MGTCHSLQNYPKTIHGEFKGRLFCYRNTTHHHEFVPFLENTTSKFSKRSSTHLSKADTKRDTIAECKLELLRPTSDERRPSVARESNFERGSEHVHHVEQAQRPQGGVRHERRHYLPHDKD